MSSGINWLILSKFANDVIAYDDAWILQDKVLGKRYAEILVQDSLINDTKDVNWSAELEETHEETTEKSWIDKYERDRVIEALKAMLGERGQQRVIEFGASTGYMIQDIKHSFPGNELIATDLYAEGLHKSYCRNPDIRHIQCDNTDAPFADESMDVFVSLNVLEHIEDDEKAIAECYRILKVHGGGIFVVPRGDKLYDYYDEALYHKRRYADGELRRKCEAAGFEVIDNNHLATLIYPAFWCKKKWNRYQWKKGQTYEESMQKTKQDINRVKDSSIAKMISDIEAKLYRKMKFRHGIREIIVLRK